MLKRTAALCLAISLGGSGAAMAQGFPGLGCGCGARPAGPPPVFAPLAPLGIPPICPLALGHPGPGPMMPQPVPCPPMLPPCDPCAPVMPVMPMMQTTMRPVVETRMRQESFTTYENVARTEVRREAMQVTVPVTSQKQVTVDEGGYQMVWVSKPVTKTIAETTYRQETRYRDVPYQVVQTVPRQVTRMVPENTVRYVPETRMVQGCANCGPVGAFVPPVVGAMPAQAAPMLTPVPDQGGQRSVVPSPYEAQGAAPGTSGQAAPPAQSSDNSEWTTIKQKSASTEGIELQSYERTSPSDVNSGSPPKRLFSPVPSAAAVWQTQFRR